METYKGYQIRRSGKDFFRIYQNGQSTLYMRVKSIEAAKVLISSNGRVMTRKEKSLVYGEPMTHQPTKEQLAIEEMIKAGKIEGLI